MIITSLKISVINPPKSQSVEQNLQLRLSREAATFFFGVKIKCTSVFPRKVCFCYTISTFDGSQLPKWSVNKVLRVTLVDMICQSLSIFQIDKDKFCENCKNRRLETHFSLKHYNKNDWLKNSEGILILWWI